MKVIVEIDKVVQQYAPGQTGRYDDEFEPRAFGDNIQKWGTSAILIESVVTGTIRKNNSSASSIT
ncbi:MAG: hypothetical protein U5K51_04450 [Flavobacteriaceae bacterium]|nr:hypothetical protein [Flavobacteriaceae bacterium]